MDKKYKRIIFVTFIIALLAILQSTTPPVGVQWVVNNTNKAPNVPGHSPGTGERIGDNTTYWANSSPIQIFLYSHANTTGQAAEIHLFINGTKVSDTSGRALGIAEQSNRSIVATVPQYANYSVEMVNYHHYEWYEYPILTGTVTTTITIGTGSTTGAGCVGHSGNCSFDMVLLNHLATNTTGGFVNILLHDGFENNSGNFHNVLDITGATISMSSSEVVGVNSTQIVMSPLQFLIQNTNSINNYLLATQNEVVLASGTANYSFNQTSADFHNSNLTRVNNISAVDINISEGVFHTNSSSQAVFHNKVKTYIDPSTGTVLSAPKTNDDLYTFQVLCSAKQNVNSLIAFRAINDTGVPYFLGGRARGMYYPENGTAKPSALQKDDIFMRFAGNGWDGSTWSGSKIIVEYVTSNTWNATSNPARIDYHTTPNNSLTLTKAMQLESTGNLTFVKADSGITLKSPDTNDWCVRVSNAGALTVTSGKCKQ